MPWKRGLKWSGVLMIFGIIAASVFLWDPLPANPSSEILAANASKYDAEIIRDNYGVPHIFGKTDADVTFGVGYAHAEDDFQTIQESVAATRGLMARYNGSDGAPTDYIVALFDVWDTVDAKYESEVSDEVKAIADAYVAGLNLYASENPDKIMHGLAPFKAKDVIAGSLFKTPFFYGLDGTLLELFSDDRMAEIALDPGNGETAWMVSDRKAPKRGSNAFAVAPSRSTDDVTRLIINSHQPMTGPVAWWEAHLVSEEGLDIQGGMFPGSPMVLHGFNRNLGWANTVSNPDLSDVYKLVINPKNENQYRLDGKWENFEVKTAKIRIKIFGPFAYTSEQKILRSQHGPVIQSKKGSFAIRYAGMGEMRQTEQRLKVSKARNWDEFYAAMSMNALPSINYVYADKDGVVALIHNGQYPNRVEGWDWTKDMPGDRSDLIWDGYRPYDAVPILLNPKSGFVYNSNNQPYDATDGPDNLRPEDFPKSMGLQTDQTNRSLRIMELTDGITKLDRAALLAIKFDTGYAKNSQADKVVSAVLGHDWSAEPDMAAAAKHLAAWNRKMDIKNRHAALGGLTVVHEITERFTKIPAPEPLDAFRQAVDYLNKHYGRIDPEWGEINRLVRGDLSLPVSGASDTLRAIYPAEVRDDGKLHAIAGDTWIAMVEWDRSGKQSARVIHQFGNATLDKNSPHYADQAELFVAEKWRTALIERGEIEAAATRRYRPGRE
ncbi:penicillin acylase family protein [Sphingorhabdus sp. Alg231-15]|uniref:penicillin acylase family protein n=1 Tax=Sphingorhabdus sp. Alg231-15 TaxID=1922222 RepID=UPI000D54BC41